MSSPAQSPKTCSIQTKCFMPCIHSYHCCAHPAVLRFAHDRCQSILCVASHRKFPHRCDYENVDQLQARPRAPARGSRSSAPRSKIKSPSEKLRTRPGTTALRFHAKFAFAPRRTFFLSKSGSSHRLSARHWHGGKSPQQLQSSLQRTRRPVKETPIDPSQRLRMETQTSHG
jgi:hypothetical protein